MDETNTNEEAKTIGRSKLQLAIENLKTAELEGALRLAPDTYSWAKNKIYEDKKMILKHAEDPEIVEEASDDACAAAAQLLSIVRKHQTTEAPKEDPIKVLVNEGGPVK